MNFNMSENRWGSHIQWFDTNEFSQWDENTIFSIWGHKPRIAIGDTVTSEFKHTINRFEIVSLDKKSNPPDMFFGKVKFISQEDK